MGVMQAKIGPELGFGLGLGLSHVYTLHLDLPTSKGMSQGMQIHRCTFHTQPLPPSPSPPPRG